MQDWQASKSPNSRLRVSWHVAGVRCSHQGPAADSRTSMVSAAALLPAQDDTSTRSVATKTRDQDTTQIDAHTRTMHEQSTSRHAKTQRAAQQVLAAVHQGAATGHGSPTPSTHAHCVMSPCSCRAAGATLVLPPCNRMCRRPSRKHCPVTHVTRQAYACAGCARPPQHARVTASLHQCCSAGSCCCRCCSCPAGHTPPQQHHHIRRHLPCHQPQASRRPRRPARRHGACHRRRACCVHRRLLAARPAPQ